MSTSKLQRYVSDQLSIHFGGMTIRENIRPDWLVTDDGARLELDFFIEGIKVAIEVQGQQHYQYIEFMHGNPDGFERRKEYDDFKRVRCDERGIKLLEISSVNDASDVIDYLLSYMASYCIDPFNVTIPNTRIISAPNKHLNSKRARKLRALDGFTRGLQRMVKSDKYTDEQIKDRIDLIKRTAQNLGVSVSRDHFKD